MARETKDKRCETFKYQNHQMTDNQIQHITLYLNALKISWICVDQWFVNEICLDLVGSMISEGKLLGLDWNCWEWHK